MTTACSILFVYTLFCLCTACHSFFPMLTILLVSSCLAAAHRRSENGYCQQILDACNSSGFRPNKQSFGYDLYANCANPIMQKLDNGPFALYSLPIVHADTVYKCKMENPDFGVGPVGSSGAQYLACYQLKKRCLIDGFEPDKQDAGYDLDQNCINPMLQPTISNTNSIFPVPDIGQDLIDRCAQEIPGFGSGLVGAPNANKLNCHAIKQHCINSGFVEGKWRYGYGLWKNCINPIMQRVDQHNVPYQLLKLPKISPAVISSCKAENPSFGVGFVGSEGGQKHSCYKIKEYCAGRKHKKHCVRKIIKGKSGHARIEAGVVEQCRKDIPEFGH